VCFKLLQKTFTGALKVTSKTLCFVLFCFVEESSRAEGISEFEATNLRKELARTRKTKIKFQNPHDVR
jgi:hypothetical protein